MSEALGYLKYAAEHFIEGILEEAEILPGVSIGYILLTVILIGLLMGTIMAIPNQMSVGGTVKGIGRSLKKKDE